MARPVMLYKESHTPDYVTYKFGPDRDTLGVIRLDLRTGDVDVVEDIPNYGLYHRFRAQQYLQQLYEEGRYPEVTSFA
ncbi:hypothetical protein [Paenibacillus gansuensis]|uniref:KTSC domain-containing protein n=1 Tax=Paenibacillus gansuensis TaxID=306542 RepID=A0ABW5PMJ2_9BACL